MSYEVMTMRYINLYYITLHYITSLSEKVERQNKTYYRPNMYLVDGDASGCY